VWRLGTDPRLLLDSLAVAVAVLTEPDPAGAVAVADRHGLLNPAGRCTPTGPDSALRRRRHNALLAALRLGVAYEAGELSPSAQLTVRVGSGRPRYPEPGIWCGRGDGPLRGGQLPLRAVPQLLWSGLLTDHLPDVCAGTTAGVRPTADSDLAGGAVLARACAAMFLARLGSTRPWRLIAIELGLPAWLAQHLPALHRRLVERGRWPAFLADLNRLATALQNDLPPVDYRARRQLAADPRRLLAVVRAGRQLAEELTPPAVPDEVLARMFWQSYTCGDLRLAAPPVGWTDLTVAAARQHHLDQLRPAAMPVLLATQAVLEARSPVGGTGPLVWSPAPGHCAVLLAAAKDDLAEAWSRPAGQEQDWDDWQHNVALAAALSAAEQDLTEHAFAPWLWRWLDVNYGIPDTDGTAFWVPLVWALRGALTDPDTDPDVVEQPALARALRHSTRSPDGTAQRWQLLRDAPTGRH